jgi:predicted ATPase/class 3 adenylate cyclase
MLALPTGTVAFMFTDIEGSTRLWESFPEEMKASLRKHDDLLANAVKKNGGYVFKTVGDAFCAVFDAVLPAIGAAIDAQIALSNETWPGTNPIRVRIAIHVGVTDERNGDYFGPVVNRVARLLNAGHGGQILLSGAAHELAVESAPPDGIAFRSLGTHRLKDLRAPQEVFEVVGPNLAVVERPLRTIDSHPNNLPIYADTFFGREEELTEVVHLVGVENVRLLTLTGPGGIGKTRLALQAASDLIDRFPDGVFLVDLCAVRDSENVAAEIAQTINCTTRNATTHLSALIEWAAGKQALLVLDNMEQLTDAGSDIGELVAKTRGISLMVTSREALRIRPEREHPVRSLETPKSANERLSKITQYESVRLFVERAVSSSAGFEVTNENAPAVAEICTRLDGLPLAIELAAARIRVMSPDDLLERLSRKLSSLGRGARDLPMRQQTLQNAIDWSYDMLSDSEKVAFQLFSVLENGASLDQIEELLDPPLADKADSIDVIESLVDKSLIQFSGDPNQSRYAMLETIRAYARQKLKENGLEEDARNLHAQVYLSFAGKNGFPYSVVYEEDDPAMPKLAYEDKNLSSAFERFEKDEFHSEVLQMVSALWPYWLRRGYGDPIGAIERTLKMTDDRSSAAYLNTVFGAGVMRKLWYYDPNYEDMDRTIADEYLSRAADIAKETGEILLFGHAHFELADLALEKGEIGRAKNHIEKASESYSFCGYTDGVEYCKYTLAVAEARSQKVEQVANITNSFLDSANAGRYSSLRRVFLILAAQSMRDSGEPKQAIGYLEQLLDVDIGAATHRSDPMNQLAGLYAEVGRHEEAAVVWEKWQATARHSHHDFYDLLLVSDMSFQKILMQVETEDVAHALKGADPQLVHKTTQNMSRRAAQSTLNYMDSIAFIDEDAIEQARSKILRILNTLIDEGEIEQILRGNGGQLARARSMAYLAHLRMRAGEKSDSLRILTDAIQLLLPIVQPWERIHALGLFCLAGTEVGELDSVRTGVLDILSFVVEGGIHGILKDEFFQVPIAVALHIAAKFSGEKEDESVVSPIRDAASYLWQKNRQDLTLRSTLWWPWTPYDWGFGTARIDQPQISEVSQEDIESAIRAAIKLVV